MTIQIWFGVVDAGLGPMIGRETSRYLAGAIQFDEYTKIYGATLLVFLLLGAIISTALYSSSELIALKWLNTDESMQKNSTYFVKLIFITATVRWASGFFKSLLLGSESIRTLAFINIVAATSRFVLVYFALGAWGNTLEVFFLWQIVTCVLELVALVVSTEVARPILFSLKHDVCEYYTALKSRAGFSLSLAFSTIIWIVVTQVDKLLLSGMLPIEQYAKFSIAVSLAYGVILITAPLGNSFWPRMSSLYASDNKVEFYRLYGIYSQVIATIGLACGFVLYFFSFEIVSVWLGDAVEEKIMVSKILELYAIGNGLMVVSGIPYMLQFSIGNLKYHRLGSIFLCVLIFPALYFYVGSFGATGAGLAWVTVNMIFLLIWVPIVKIKLTDISYTLAWYQKEILPVVLLTFLVSMSVKMIYAHIGINENPIFFIIAASIITPIVPLLAIGKLRRFALGRLFTN